MGILTDPSGLRGRPFQLLINHHGLICGLLYVSSIIWYCLLASDHINAATYLSENALLPGLVSLGSDVTQDAKNYLKELDTVLADNIKPGNRGNFGTTEIPSPWLRGKFAQMGVESYVHNFTLNYPLNVGQKFEGKNVYGIIRGGGSSNEAIVLSVPFRGPDSPHPNTKPSIALLLAITKYFRRQKYWAKDLIMLVTQHELLGMQAWLEAYHGTTCGTKGVLQVGDLPARGGAIQAALNLEIHSTNVESIDVKLLGLNGQLPNLDLVNLVHRICSKERVKHSFSNREKIHHLSPQEQWLNSFKTMTTMVLSQMTGVPDGNHGLFHRFGIEAVTMEGDEKVGHSSQITLYHIGRVIEGVFRSINNLLERFHQSYFFYILTDTDRFISIALYIVSIGGMSAPLLLKAFSNQVSLRVQSDEEKPKGYDYNVGGVFLTIFFCFSIGLISFHTPVIASSYVFKGMLKSETAVLIGLTFISVAGIIAVEICARMSKPREWALLNIVVLIHTATTILAISMSNFSFAFVTAIIIVPMVLLVDTNLARWVRSLLCLLCHPFVIVFLFICAKQYIHMGHVELKPAVNALGEALVLSTLDTLIYGATALTYTTLAYTPLWHMCFILARAKQIKLKQKSE